MVNNVLYCTKIYIGIPVQRGNLFQFEGIK